MSAFFPPLAYIALGFGGGVLVNGLADWLASRRELVEGGHAEFLFKPTYWGLISFPFRNVEVLPFWHIRVAVVWVLTLGSSIWLGLFTPDEIAYWWASPLFLYLLLVAVMDIEHKVILFPVAIAGAGIGLVVGVFLRGWAATLLGGVAGFLVMLVLFQGAGWVMALVTRFRGDEPVEEVPLGFGDVNLSAVMGLLLGFPGIFAGLVLTILLGGIAGLFYIIGMRIKGSYRPYLAIPYGPNLVLAIFVLLYFRAWF
jgi:leader peptidase (prepilin peptidase)/N-methyltransferase